MRYYRINQILISFLCLSTQIFSQEEYRFSEVPYETVFRELYTNPEGENIALISTIDNELNMNYIVKLENEEVNLFFEIEGRYELAFIYNHTLYFATSNNGGIYLHILNNGLESYDSISMELATNFHLYDICVLDNGYLISGNVSGQIRYVKLDPAGNEMNIYEDDQFTFQYPEFLTFMEQRENGTILSAIYCDRLALLDPNDFSSIEWQIQPQICGPIDRMVSTQGSDLGEYAVLGSSAVDGGVYHDLTFQSRSFNEEPTNWFYLSAEDLHYIHGDAHVAEDVIYFSSVLKNTFDIGGQNDFNLSITDHSGNLLDSFTWVTPQLQESLAELYVGVDDVWIYSSQLDDNNPGHQAYALRIPKEMLNHTSLGHIEQSNDLQLEVSSSNWKVKSNDHRSLLGEIHTIDGRLLKSKNGMAQLIFDRNALPSGILILKVTSDNSTHSWKLFEP